MKELAGRAWRGWLEVARYFGDFQARLLLTLFYFTVLVPFAAGLRLFGDPLRLRRPPEASGWEAREGQDADLAASRRQF